MDALSAGRMYALAISASRQFGRRGTSGRTRRRLSVAWRPSKPGTIRATLELRPDMQRCWPSAQVVSELRRCTASSTSSSAQRRPVSFRRAGPDNGTSGRVRVHQCRFVIRLGRTPDPAIRIVGGRIGRPWYGPVPRACRPPGRRGSLRRGGRPPASESRVSDGRFGRRSSCACGPASPCKTMCAARSACLPVSVKPPRSSMPTRPTSS